MLESRCGLPGGKDGHDLAWIVILLLKEGFLGFFISCSLRSRRHIGFAEGLVCLICELRGSCVFHTTEKGCYSTYNPCLLLRRILFAGRITSDGELQLGEVVRGRSHVMAWPACVTVPGFTRGLRGLAAILSSCHACHQVDWDAATLRRSG